GDVVIVGDRSDIQISLINSGCSAIIITGDSPVSYEVESAAAKAGTLIISSPHDTFITAHSPAT
ncbi:MAG: inorganic diphosphatase, partial [Methanophagales archaeon]|nr:inorganic diphosphatase [Methanophagales archaeon]